MHYFVTEMCTCVHTSVKNGALGDICPMHCGFYKMSLLRDETIGISTRNRINNWTNFPKLIKPDLDTNKFQWYMQSLGNTTCKCALQQCLIYPHHASILQMTDLCVKM